MPRTDMAFYDPDGETHDRPTYPYGAAPAHLATRRQLALVGLRPASPVPDAYLAYRVFRKERVASLWDVEAAVPKRRHDTVSQRRVAAMLRARRTCGHCGRTHDYYIPRSLGWCLDCQERWEQRQPSRRGRPLEVRI